MSTEPNPVPPPIVPTPRPPAPHSEALAFFLKGARLVLARNPFYILSAALLVWSMYRLSLDGRIFPTEFGQLFFNFSSLEVYELLLAATAIALARRLVFYDSGLLVGLDNLLVCVPFLLISQALLLEKSVAMEIGLAGCALALVRWRALRIGLPQPNLPKSLFWAGGLSLAFNLGWPVLARVLHQTRDRQMWDDIGARLNYWDWNWIAPMLVALAWLLPAKRPAVEAKADEEAPFYARRLFPLLTLLCWAAGTCVHLYCINYVYSLPFEMTMLLPAAWAAAWLPWRYASNLAPEWVRAGGGRLALAGPMVVVLTCLIADDPQRAWTLAALSLVCYGAIALRRRDRLAAKLAVASAVVALAFAPAHFGAAGAGVAFGWSHGRLLVALGLAYAIAWAALSRDAKLGILGGLCLTIGVGVCFPTSLMALNMAMQAGLAFVLLHSMRWSVAENRDAGQARALCAGYWFIHSLIWTLADSGEAIYGTSVCGAAVLGACVAARWLTGMWGPRLIAGAGLAVAACGPAILGERELTCLPEGLLILIGSFGLFALGTVAALTKSRWLPKLTFRAARMEGMAPANPGQAPGPATPLTAGN